MTKEYISGSGGSSSSAQSSTEDPTTLRSRSSAAIIDMLGEGEWEEFSNGTINLTRTFLDDVPVMNADGTYNFNNFSVLSRPGTLAQSYMPVCNTTESTSIVNVKLYKDVPIEHVVSGAELDIIRVSVLTPGLRSVDKASGNIHGTTVQFKIEYNSADNQAWRVVENGTGETSTTTMTGSTDLIGHEEYVLSWTASPIFGDHGAQYPSNVFIQKNVNNSGWVTVVSRQGVYEGTETVKVSDTDVVSFRVTNDANAASGVCSITSVYGINSNKTGVFTISGKCSSNYEKQISFRPVGTAPYIVRVTKVTSDSSTEYLSNDLYFYSLAAAQEEKYRYPGSVLVGWKIDAEQFSSLPTRSYKCKMLKIKIPANYDPITREYSGLWNGMFKVAWSDNPAWCFYDLITNKRYGLGERIPESMVDKWALYKIAQYCDELVDNGYGVKEPRFTCNLIINSRQEAYKVVADMATIFNGITYWGLGSIVPVQDSPKDPLYLFNNTNVENGIFSYTSSRYDTRYNAVNVTWNNPKDQYKQAVAYVEDTNSIATKGYVNLTSGVAIGCTSEAQARRYGRWVLYTNGHDTDVVTFTTGAEGAIPRPGDIIQVSDTLRATERRGGRVISSNGTVVVLDKEMTFTAGVTYTISLIAIDGTMMEATFTQDGATDSITLSSSLTNDVAQDSSYIISDDAIPVALFRVISVADKGEGKYEVNALTHNPSKYAYVDNQTPLVDIGMKSKLANAPSNLTVNEVIHSVGSTTVSSLDIGWTAAKFAKTYHVKIKADDGRVWDDETTSVNYVLDNATKGTYTVYVNAVSVLGVSSEAVSATCEVVGGGIVPAPVSAITYEIVPSGTVKMSWEAITSFNTKGYEVRDVDSGWGTTGYLFHGQATSCSLTPVQGSKVYYLRAFDDKNTYSETSKSIEITCNAPSGVSNITHLFVDSTTVTFKWDAPVSDFVVTSYDVTLNSNDSTISRTATVGANEWSTQSDWVGDAVFTVTPSNIIGWKGNTTNHNFSKSVPSTPPPTPTNLHVTSGFSSIFVEWDAPVYVIGRGNAYTEIWAATYSGTGDLPTVATATLVGTAAGASTIYADSVPKLGEQRHYWIRFVSYDGVASGYAGGLNGAYTATGLVGGVDLSPLIIDASKIADGAVALNGTKVSGTLDNPSLFGAAVIGSAAIQNAAITNVLIKDAAVDNAKIASCAVDKLTAGSLQVGSYIQSPNYIAGTSGWKINSDGTAEFGAASIRGQLTASQINTTGLFVGADFTNAVTDIAGETTSILTLTSEAVSLPANSSGVVTSYANATSTVKVMSGTTDETSLWTISTTPSTGITITFSSNVLTITNVTSSTSSGYVTVTATRSGYTTLTKQYNISKASDGTSGTSGTNGTSPYVFTLSNYSAVFPADSSGNVTSTTGNTTVVNVMQGTSDVTSNTSISYTTVGCGVSQSGTTFTITGFSADSGYVAFTARVNDPIAGYVYMYKTYSWSKAKAGTAGINGTNGTNGTSGSPGLRGIAYLTKQVTYATAASITPAICSAALPDGTPQLGDVVSFFNPNASPPWSTSRIYTASGWSSVALFVDGNAVVKGTLSAAVIATGEANVFSASSGYVGIGKTAPVGAKGSSPLAVYRTNTAVPSLHVGEYYTGYGATYWLADFVSGGQYGIRVQPQLDRTSQGAGVGVRIDGNGSVGLYVSGQSINSNGTENAYSGKWYNACAQFNNKNSGSVKTTYIGYGAYPYYAAYAPSGSGKGNFVDGVGAFTGIHIVGCNYLPEQGDIMIDVELLSNHDIANNQTRVETSSKAKQKGAIGIYNDEAMFDSSWDNAEKPEYALHVNAIGDGMINVTGEGGDIEIGDYIITSSTRGKGMKQEDDLLHNYTVARSRQNVSFKSKDEVKQIACVYVCG